MTATVLSSTLSTVVNCNGSLEKVETKQQAGESVTDFQQRHRDAVAAARASCTGTATVQPTTYNTPVDCNGTISDVFSTQDPGESITDFFDRHNDLVRDAVNECP